MDYIEMSDYSKKYCNFLKEIKVYFVVRKGVLKVIWRNEGIKENIDIFDYKIKWNLY